MSVQFKKHRRETDTFDRLSEVLRKRIHLQVMVDQENTADTGNCDAPELTPSGFLYIP